MTQNEKDILLKDLCARLPYGVWIERKFKSYTFSAKAILRAHNISAIEREQYEFCKPYLFPLSSMTKKQYEEWCDLEAEPLDEILTRNANGEKMSTLEHHLLVAKSLTDPVNYCYKNHFDIYGLIPMGLANDATGLNIY